MNEEMNTTVISEETGVETAKTYTEAEVLDMVQREADKRVSQALKTQQAKFQKQLTEAEKLRDMDAEQRKNYEFEQKLAEFEEQKSQFTLMQNKVQATQILSERNLPVQFVDYIVSADAETMLDNINTFDKLFKACVADAVTARIQTNTPRGGVTKQSGITKDDFKKMTISQQSEIYNSNPNLYRELIN